MTPAAPSRIGPALGTCWRRKEGGSCSTQGGATVRRRQPPVTTGHRPHPLCKCPRYRSLNRHSRHPVSREDRPAAASARGPMVRTVCRRFPTRTTTINVKLSAGSRPKTPEAIWANQFDNLANRRAHYSHITTGPENLGAETRRPCGMPGVRHRHGARMPGWRFISRSRSPAVWRCGCSPILMAAALQQAGATKAGELEGRGKARSTRGDRQQPHSAAHWKGAPGG